MVPGDGYVKVFAVAEGIVKQISIERLLLWLAEFVTLFLIWLLFVSKLELLESLVGLLAVLIATIASEVVRGNNLARFYPHTHWLVQLWRLPGYVVTDIAIIFAVLAGRLVFKKK